MNLKRDSFFNTQLFDLFVLFILYFLSYGLILVNEGIFWDDWNIFKQDKNTLIEIFNLAGASFVGFFHIFLQSFDSGVVEFYRIIVFICYLLSGFLLYQILKSINQVSSQDRFFLTSIFLIFPVNSARITMICSPYAICYLLFWGGFYFLTKGIRNKSYFYQFIAILSFFLSFFTNSILVFYIIVIFYIFYIEYQYEKKIFSLAVTVIKKYWIFGILPILFWIGKLYVWAPTGLFSGYNTINPKLVFEFYPHLVSIENSFWINLGINIYHSDLILNLTSVFFTTLTLIYFINLRISMKQSLKNTINKIKSNFLFLLFGYILLITAVYPYVVVGQSPHMSDWNSRHQLLIPLGASFTLYYLIQTLFIVLGIDFKKKLNALVLFFFLSIFITKNIYLYSDFLKDHYKQLSLMEHFKKDPIFYSNTLFIINDTTNMKANNREHRFYEFSGMFKKTFGDETRFAAISLEKSKINANTNLKWVNLKDFNFDYEKPQFFTLNSSETGKKLENSMLYLTKIILLSLFDRESFDSVIKDITNITKD